LSLDPDSSIGLILNLQQQALVCDHNQGLAKSDTSLRDTQGLLHVFTELVFAWLILLQSILAVNYLLGQLSLVLFYLRQFLQLLSRVLNQLDQIVLLNS
jgi:hypothetical protein